MYGVEINAIVDTLAFGARSEWEKHEIGGQVRFVKPIATADMQMKARIASRFAELGFIPKFFREHGQEFVALEGIASNHYQDVERAFAEQILSHL